jgi:hypothetical protein
MDGGNAGGARPSARYDAPQDLPQVDVVARCETDLTILVEEPEVGAPRGNRNQGFDWIGVKGVEVSIRQGSTTFTATTDAQGKARYSAVPCGLYVVTLRQAEFRIENKGDTNLKVNGSSKSGREKELRIRRQLRTVEMFRLPTQYMVAVGAKDATGDDPYGHHWTKIYASEADASRERPMESYGWWPAAGALTSDWDTFTGVRGALNGYSPSGPSYAGASPTTDPYHTKSRTYESLEDVFFPWVTNGKTAAEYKSILRTKAQSFARDVSNTWSWRTDGGGWHCKTFQAYLMREAFLWKHVGVGIGQFGWSTSTS